MTKLTAGKTVTRETAAVERSNPVVVVLHPRYLTVRIKGHREAYNLDYELLLALRRRRAFEQQHHAVIPKKRPANRQPNGRMLNSPGV